jgi:hypothetical protein
MNMRIVSAEYLLMVWEENVSTTFFPRVLYDELRPMDILDSWGDELPAYRERYRPEVDTFIEELLDLEDPRKFWLALSKLDHRVMALYCDRLNTATCALKSLEAEMVQVPESWATFVAQLLFQRTLQ